MSIAILSMAVIQLLLMGVIILGVRLTHMDLVSLAIRSRESASFDAKCLMDSTMKRLDDIDNKLDGQEVKLDNVKAIVEYVEHRVCESFLGHGRREPDGPPVCLECGWPMDSTPPGVTCTEDHVDDEQEEEPTPEEEEASLKEREKKRWAEAWAREECPYCKKLRPDCKCTDIPF